MLISTAFAVENASGGIIKYAYVMQYILRQLLSRQSHSCYKNVNESSPKYSQLTPHSLPMRTRYGVSNVTSDYVPRLVSCTIVFILD